MQDKGTGTSLNHQCRQLAKGTAWSKIIMDLLLPYFLENKTVYLFYLFIINVIYI